MKHAVAISTSIVFVLFSSFAVADASTKAQLLDQFFANRTEAQQALMDGILKKSAMDLVGSDQRLISVRQQKADALAGTIDKAELRKKVRDMMDKQFTEEELKYVISMVQSNVGKKWGAFSGTIAKEMRTEVDAQMEKNYEKATGVKWDPGVRAKANGQPTPYSPGGGGGGTAKPNWATKLVWGMFPDQKNACGGQ